MLTGNVGPNACHALLAAGLEVHSGATKSVRQVMEAYSRGALQEATELSVGSYPGVEQTPSEPHPAGSREGGPASQVRGTPIIYSARVLAYFLNPTHAFQVEQPDEIGVGRCLSCGDYVGGERLIEVSHQTSGSPAAIPTCELAVEVATGKTFDEAQRISDKSVTEFLRELPETKLHCSNSAADGLCCAIADYRGENQSRDDQTTTEVIEDATR